MTDTTVETPVVNLHHEVKKWLKRNDISGTSGLVLMSELAEHIALHRDWDAAAMLMGKSDATVRGIFKRILMARFGVRLQFAMKPGLKHGCKFVMKWADGEYPAVLNSYGVVTDGIAKGRRYNDPDFLKDLREVTSKEPEVKAFDTEAFASSLAKRLDDGRAPISVLIVALQKTIENLREQQTAVVIINDTGDKVAA